MIPNTTHVMPMTLPPSTYPWVPAPQPQGCGGCCRCCCRCSRPQQPVWVWSGTGNGTVPLTFGDPIDLDAEASADD